MAFPWVAKGTGTDQELLDLARAAMAQIMATGQSYTEDGQALTRADLPELRRQVTWLEQRIAAAAASGPAENVVRMTRPSGRSNCD